MVKKTCQKYKNGVQKPIRQGVGENRKMPHPIGSNEVPGAWKKLKVKCNNRMENLEYMRKSHGNSMGDGKNKKTDL